MPFHEPPSDSIDDSFDDIWCFFCQSQDRDLRALQEKELRLREL